MGEEAGQPYLVMEYVAGGSLPDRLDGTPWPPRQAAVLVERLARTAHVAHQSGIVHRDLKPANVCRVYDTAAGVVSSGLDRELPRPSPSCEIDSRVRKAPDLAAQKAPRLLRAMQGSETDPALRARIEAAISG